MTQKKHLVGEMRVGKLRVDKMSPNPQDSLQKEVEHLADCSV